MALFALLTTASSLYSFSSAFDAFDHSCLASVLHDRFRVDNEELEWF
jgi:hypothetical protein